MSILATWVRFQPSSRLERSRYHTHEMPPSRFHTPSVDAGPSTSQRSPGGRRTVMVGLGPVVADQAPAGQDLVLPATELQAVERRCEGGARRGGVYPRSESKRLCKSLSRRHYHRTHGLNTPTPYPAILFNFILLPPTVRVSAA